MYSVQVNTFNVEIAIFLRAIRGHINNSGSTINNKTQELLGELVSSIDDLAHNAKVINVPNNIDVDFLNDLDDRYYGLRQNIICRLCLVSMICQWNIPRNCTIFIAQIGANYD